MNLEDWRFSFVIFGVILIAISVSPVVARIAPPKLETFAAMGILGEDLKAENYYPGDNPEISLGSTMKWNIYLYNHMGRTEYFTVKIKFLDLGSSPPNSSLGTSSPALSFFEFGRVLANNETTFTAFEWSIIDANNSSDSLMIKKIIVNGHTMDANVVLSNRGKLRIVFELWVYDDDSMSFKFNLGSVEDPKCVWNQMWFAIKAQLY